MARRYFAYDTDYWDSFSVEYVDKIMDFWYSNLGLTRQVYVQTSSLLWMISVVPLDDNMNGKMNAIGLTLLMIASALAGCTSGDPDGDGEMGIDMIC